MTKSKEGPNDWPDPGEIADTPGKFKTPDEGCTDRDGGAPIYFNPDGSSKDDSPIDPAKEWKTYLEDDRYWPQ